MIPFANTIIEWVRRQNDLLDLKIRNCCPRSNIYFVGFLDTQAAQGRRPVLLYSSLHIKVSSNI